MSETVSETLRAFYAGHRQQLYTYALSITRQREAAEDAIQRAFQQLLSRNALPADLRPYVFRCVRNAALDGLRRDQTRQESIFANDGHAELATPLSGPLLSAAEIDAQLQRLSPDERETLVLKIYDALTFQEIAELRDVPLPTVASWYRRGLEKLRALLAKESLP
jgi:RNA polymerase sigma-70 factor (ECF subfamily)